MPDPRKSPRPKRKALYGVFVPPEEAASGALRWTMQSEGLQQASSRPNANWWVQVSNKKEALALAKRFYGIVTTKPYSSTRFDGPTFLASSTVEADFRAKPRHGRLVKGDDPVRR